jgi:hypothetical protein
LTHRSIPAAVRPAQAAAADAADAAAGPLLARNLATRGNVVIELAWHDPSRITPEDIAAYRKPTQVEDWDRALWEFTLAGRDLSLEQQVRCWPPWLAEMFAL